MKKKLSKIIVAASAACYLFSAITAYAAWTSSGSTDNYVSMGSYKTTIVEEYTQPQHVDPSDTVDKIVNVKNSGTVGTFIRVAVEKQIGDVDAGGVFTPDKTLDPEMIRITYNDTVWKNGGDGYFYYLKELKPGETTEEPLFKSYTLDPAAGNAYRKKQGHIVVKMESVQAEGNAVTLWGKTTYDLGIQYKEAEQTADPTLVTFLGKEQGFDITSKKPDLFTNFKNLMPGTSRTQEIKVANKSGEDVTISLQAEAVDQDKMSEDQLELVNRLINEYATISIENDGNVIYEGPVSGRTKMQDQAASLGAFQSGTEKNMTVKLSVSPEMDNQYLDLLGKVRWVFTASGEDPEGTPVSTPVNPPKTGDRDLTPAAALFATATLLLGAGIVLWKKKDGANA